jgi:thioredoxin 1
MKLIAFKQDNCVPCNMLNDTLKGLGSSIDSVDQIVNLSQPKGDEDLMLAGKFGIQKTPTLVLVDDNGEQIDLYKGVGQTGVKRILTQRGLI